MRRLFQSIYNIYDGNILYGAIITVVVLHIIVFLIIISGDIAWRIEYLIKGWGCE